MTIIADLITFCILIAHVKDLKKVQFLEKQPENQGYPMFLLLNICSTSGGAIGFGASYLPPLVSLVSLFAIALRNRAYPGTAEWIERRHRRSVHIFPFSSFLFPGCDMSRLSLIFP